MRERLNGCVACLGLDDCRQSQIEILMQICVLLARRTIARLHDQQTMMQTAVQLLVSRAERQNDDVAVVLDQIRNSSSFSIDAFRLATR